MKPSEYRKLIQQFLDGYFAEAEDFAKIYDKTFLSEPGGMSKELFSILEDFWEDVEVFSPLWTPEDIDELHITEETLRKEAMDALGKLDKYLHEHPD